MTKDDSRPGAIIIEGHVQGLSNTRSLGEKGIHVYVVDKTDCIARYSKYCKKFFKCPEFILDEFAYFLISLAKKESINNWLLMPSNDHAVYCISKHKERLSKYYKIFSPDLEVIKIIYDKFFFLKFAKDQGIPIPFTMEISPDDTDNTIQIKFPSILKGKNGLTFYKKMGTKVFFINSKDDYLLYINKLEKKGQINNTIVQEVIPTNKRNKTISFTAFCIAGDIKAHWSGVKIREHPITFGTATFAKSSYIEACHKYSATLIKALKYDGVCEIEFIFDHRENRYKLIEMNPRTWLWVGLAKTCKINYAIFLYNYVNNIPDFYPQNYPNNQYWINNLTDFVFSLQALIRGKLNIIDYFKTIIFTKKTFAVLSLKDIKPGLLIPALILKRILKK